MKKILLITVLLITSYNLFAFTIQGAWRWRKDDGSEASATWRANQNLPINIFRTDSILRLRIEQYDSVAGNDLAGSILQDSLAGGSGWETIDTGQGTKSFVLAGKSLFVTDLEQTTAQLKGRESYSFIPGYVIVSSPQYPNPGASLDNNKKTENEFAFRPTSNIRANATYYFRFYVSVYNSGYVFPSLTTGCNIQYDGIVHNTFPAAVTIPLNTPVNGIISSIRDSDFYKFSMATAGPGKITLSNLPSDYDMYVYNSTKKQVAVSKKRGTTSEVIKGNFPKGLLYIKVVGYKQAFNSTKCYTLNITQGAALTAAATENIKTDFSFDKHDFLLFPNPVSSVLHVSIPVNIPDGYINIADVFGRTILTQTFNSTDVKVNVSKLIRGTYFVTIRNKSGRIFTTSKLVKE